MQSEQSATAPAESDDEPNRESDRDYWAKPVTGLKVAPLPTDAVNLNVEGRRLSGPIQGFGRMWRKRHRVRLDGAQVTPAEVIKAWKERFGDFWPKGNRFYGPLTGLQPGEVAVINLSMPGGAKLSTGVLVLYADDESFSLMTPQGHMFSGWITFSAYEENGCTVAQAEILMRASDPIFEIGMELFGHRQENKFWESTLAAVAAHFGVQSVADTHVECIDSRYQWSHAKNIWQNSAIRTGVYLGTAPFVSVSRRLRSRVAGPARSGPPVRDKKP